MGSYIGQTSDQFNRQLHEKEVNFIEDNAQSFADAQGIPLEDAKARLAQQGLRQVDKAWSYALGTETDAAAQAFLAQNAPTLFTVKDTYEFKDGTTNGQQEIGSLSQEAYNQLKNFYTDNVYVTTSTNSDGSMRPINEAFAKETHTALSSINGETANQAIRDFFPNMIKAAIDAPDMVVGAGNYVQNVFPTTTQERMDELYNQGNEGSKVQANLATMDVINTATMALPLGATIIKGIEKDIAATVAKETAQGAEKSVYDAKEIRSNLEEVYGKENVTSTTVVNDPLQRVNSNLTKGVEVVTDSYGNKAVKVDYIDPKTGELSKANISYDSSRGLPIFDDVAQYTTTISKPEGYETMSDIARRAAEMKQATLDLKTAINSGKVDTNQFTAQQLADIQSGSRKIDGYTWHHNAQSSPNNMQLVPNNMQLVPTAIHEEVSHIGEASFSKGK